MNFKNFGQALMMNIRLSTGEDWNLIMYDLMNTGPDCRPGVNCGTSWSPFYFIMFIMIVSYVMLNLFILVILQQFELYYLSDDNSLSKFRDDLECFKLAWVIFAKEYDGIKMREMDLMKFFRELKGNLGFKGQESDDKLILRSVVKMGVESDEDGFVYFNELLYKSMKRLHGDEHINNKKLALNEIETKKKIQQITNLQIKKSREVEKKQAVAVNPFLTIMYKRMSFKAWAKKA